MVYFAKRASAENAYIVIAWLELSLVSWMLMREGAGTHRRTISPPKSFRLLILYLCTWNYTGQRPSRGVNEAGGGG